MELEVKGLIEQVNKGLTGIKSELDTVKGEAKKSAELDAKLDKITDQVTKQVEQLQASERKQQAIEAAVNRIAVAAEKSEGADKAKLAEHKAAFEAFVRGGSEAVKDSKIKFTDGGKGLEIRSMDTEHNFDGGFLVVPELADFFVTREFETSPLRSLARVLTTSAKSMEVIIDDNEAGSGWEDEGSTQAETDTPEIGKLTIFTHKLGALPKVTTEMLEDSYIDVEAWLGQKVSDKFVRDENTAFVNGSSVKQPQGLLTLSAWTTAGTYERNKLEQVSIGASSAITGDGLIDIQAALKEMYQSNAKWLMNRATFGKILKLKGADNYFFSPTLLRDGQSTLTLLGKPVVFGSDMPVQASNSLSVAYGDFARSYTILDRVGVQLLRDPYTSKGFVSYYVTKRVGGAVTSFDALKIGKVTA